MRLVVGYLATPSGEDGLDLVRVMLKEVGNHLNPGGLLIVEIGHNRDVLEAAYPELPFTWLEVSAGDEFVFLLHRNAGTAPVCSLSGYLEGRTGDDHSSVLGAVTLLPGATALWPLVISRWFQSRRPR